MISRIFRTRSNKMAKRISRSEEFRRTQFSQASKDTGRSDPARRKQRQFLVSFVLVSLSLAIAIYGLFFSTLFQIKEVIVINASQVSTLDQHLIEQTYHYLVDRNIFLQTEHSIVSTGFGSIPRLKEVRTEMLYPETVRIHVLEKAVVLALPIKDQFALVNEDGVVVSIVPELPAPLLQVLIKQEDNTVVDTIYRNQQLFSPEQVVYAIVGKEHIEQKVGFAVTGATWYPMRKEFHLRTDQGFDIWLDSTLTVDTQVSKLTTIYGQIQKDLKAIKYIDLRIPEKVFVGK